MSPYSIFLKCTENVPPCFALLKHVQNVHQTKKKPCLYLAVQNINGDQYLSSNLFMETHSIGDSSDGNISKTGTIT